MRVDQMAAARANMRSRAHDDTPGRLLLSPEAIEALHAKQRRLNYCTGACATCCKRSYLEGDGSVLRCPLIVDGVALSDEERRLATTCSIPGLYAEAYAGKRADLQWSDTLQAIPFAVPAGCIEHALLSEALARFAAGTHAPEDMALLLEAGWVEGGAPPVPAALTAAATSTAAADGTDAAAAATAATAT